MKRLLIGLYRNVLPALCVVGLVFIYFNQPTPVNTSTTVVYRGTQGPAGPIGDTGLRGIQGIAGLAGASIAGSQGAKGDAGPAGEKGDKGDQGEQGPQGEAGEALPTTWRCNVALGKWEYKPNPALSIYTVTNGACTPV